MTTAARLARVIALPKPATLSPGLRSSLKGLLRGAREIGQQHAPAAAFPAAKMSLEGLHNTYGNKDVQTQKAF
jgi:hypothetical protein